MTALLLLMLVLLVMTALQIVRSSDLLSSAMLTGIFSLLSAGYFVLMDAVDVAFTEAAVGAGMTTILMIGALSVTATKERQGRLQWRPFVIVFGVGAALVYATFDMPRFGDPEAPIHQYVAPTFIEGAHEYHIPNVVTMVLASYRGYDTLGEVVVVFAAAVGVLLLLGERSLLVRMRRRALSLDDERRREAEEQA